MNSLLLTLQQSGIQDAGTGFVLSGALFGLLALFLIVPFSFWIWMLVDCLTNSSLKDIEKVLWFALMLFFPVIGSAVYFFGGRHERVVSEVPAPPVS